MDGPPRLAKVRVAGSSPVIRSSEVPREATSSPSSRGTYRMAIERGGLTDEVAASGLWRGLLLDREL